MMKGLLQRLTWFNPGDVLSDLIAGFTVGLVTIPHNFMFAPIAGVPIQYAMYSALLASIVYPILGRNKNVIVSSTILLRALISLYVLDGQHWLPQKAIMMTFVSGVCILVATILSAGSLLNRLSSYVLAGLVCANVISLIIAQLHYMLGIAYDPADSSPFLSLLSRFNETNFWDLGLSICCIILLLLFTVLKRIRLSPEDREPTRIQIITEKIILYIGNISGAAVLVTATAVAYRLSSEKGPFTLTGSLSYEPEFPSVVVPPFSTLGVLHSDWRVTILVPFMVPVMTVLAHVAVLKAFSGSDALISGLELSSLGIINILGSCFSCVPMSANFSRSSINALYGARTRLAGIIAGLMVVLYLTGTLAPYFSYVPRAAVATITLCALIHLTRAIIGVALQEDKQVRMVSGLVTLLIGALFSLEYGVLVGILVDIIICTLMSRREPVIVEKVQTIP